MTRVLLLALFVLASLAVATPGESRAQQLTAPQKQQMKRYYERATRAYDVGKYAEAIEDYQKAYEIGGDPAMLYNIAQAYRLGDQPAEAVRFYRRYLLRSPNARNRDDVDRKIADLERTIEERRAAAAAAPRVTEPPKTDPPGTTTTAPSTTSPSSTTSSSVATGVLTPPGSTSQPVAAPTESSSGMRVAGIVLVSVGGAALAAAGITGKLASDRADTLTNAATQHGTFDPNTEKEGQLFNNIAIGAAIAGGVVAITGAVLLIVSSSSGEDATSATTTATASVSPWIGKGSAGALATMRF